MNDTELMAIVRQRAQNDEWFQQCRSLVEQHESDFSAIRDALPYEKQLQLDAYIASCENLEHALSFIAYQVGREHGAIAAYQP